jgi:hypothetical protein
MVPLAFDNNSSSCLLDGRVRCRHGKNFVVNRKLESNGIVTPRVVVKDIGHTLNRVSNVYEGSTPGRSGACFCSGALFAVRARLVNNYLAQLLAVRVDWGETRPALQVVKRQERADVPVPG